MAPGGAWGAASAPEGKPVSGVEPAAGPRGRGGAGTARGGSTLPGLPSRTAPAQLTRAFGRAPAPGRAAAGRLGAGDAQVDMPRQARLVPDSRTRAACVWCAHRPRLRPNASPGGAGQTSRPRCVDRGRRAPGAAAWARGQRNQRSLRESAGRAGRAARSEGPGRGCSRDPYVNLSPI